MTTSLQGKYGEDLAKTLLIKRGYKILQSNFKSKFGEIDIIAKDKTQIVFVEVKARWTDKFGAPEEAVTKPKLEKIKKTIDYYYFLNPALTCDARIEVVAIQFLNS